MNEWNKNQVEIEMKNMTATEKIELELPLRGLVNYESISRCAAEAGMSVEDWTFDALAAYVRMHERDIIARQREMWPEKEEPVRKLAPWRLWLGERFYRMGDWLTDTGKEL